MNKILGLTLIGTDSQSSDSVERGWTTVEQEVVVAIAVDW